jgi:hypothetical protein
VPYCRLHLFTRPWQRLYLFPVLACGLQPIAF